jgi:hypothetical protein
MERSMVLVLVLVLLVLLVLLAGSLGTKMI